MKNILKNKNAKLAFVAIIFLLIIVSRRPDAITYPQFYAEDGVFWYSEAYSANNFWEPFLIPKQGYFQTISRIGGALGNLVDIIHAPLLFNLIAIFFELLPAVFFLSQRFSKLIPQFYIRFLCSSGYLLLLGTGETHANLTNTQWRLSILMFLIIIVPESKKIGWKIFDNLFLLLAGLSGPFVFFGLPTAIIYYYYRKSFVIFSERLAILGLTFFIQLYSYLFIEALEGAARTDQGLGAGLIVFLKILSKNIFIKGILCREYADKISQMNVWESGYIPIIVGITGISIIGYVFWKARIELKMLILFTFLAFFAALISPQATSKMPQWEYLAGGAGGRYYLLPRLAWIISLGWLFFNSNIKFLTAFAGVSLFSFVFLGLFWEWTFPRFHDYHFKKQILEFENINKGETYTFKIVPNWKMNLVKK